MVSENPKTIAARICDVGSTFKIIPPVAREGWGKGSLAVAN